MNSYQPSPQTQQLLADLEAAARTPYGIYWDWHEVGAMPAAVDDAMYYARLLALRARMVSIYIALAHGSVVPVNPAEQAAAVEQERVQAEALQASQGAP